MIRTKRLNVRMASDEEMRAMIASERDPELQKAYGEMLSLAVAHPESRPWYIAWVAELPTGERVGDLCFKGLQPDGSLEVGYGILPEHQGRGYATEAVTALIGWAAGQPGVRRIEAETEPDNAASRRVLEKIGFVPTGETGEEGPRFVWFPGGLHLEPVDVRNVWKILKLRVSEQQKEFVAPNDASIVEAYLTLAAGGHVFPFGVMAGEEPVGFVMIGYGVDDAYEDAPRIAYGNYSVWRLMIDERYQGRGYGSAALRLAIAFIRTYPCGPAEYAWLSYDPENERAREMYARLGFRETGEQEDGEDIAVLRL